MWQLAGSSRIISNDETLPVVRQSQSLGDGVQYSQGKLLRDPTTDQSFTIAANVQPLSGRDILLLPEGDRFIEQYWVWTQDQTNGIAVRDLVTRCGNVYQVQEAANWGSYTRARMMLIDTLPELP